MRYMLMVMGDADYEEGKPAPAELYTLMGEFIGKLAEQGVFVDGTGLLPTRHGFRAKARDGEITLTDGPFSEAKEIVGGYAIFEVPDEDTVRRLAREFVGLHTQTGYTEVDCEIRRMEDAPEAE